MRKIIAGFLTLTIALALLSGCGAENKPTTGSGDWAANVGSTTQTPEDKTEAPKTESAAPASQPKVSIEAPKDWKTKEGSTALAHYQNGMASFIVTCDTVPTDIKSPDEYVQYSQEQYKKTFSDAAFAETKTVTVDGVEGRDYSFTYSVSGMKMKTRVVYLLKDSKAYTLTCGTLEEEFDKAADDFQGMIDSFKLQ